MQVTELLNIERISCCNEAGSKKRVLEQMSQLIATGQTELSQDQIFDSLISRERLGSTGLGHGVAIPHARVENSDKTLAAVIKLRQGVDYDAPDQKPVDLIFALLVPENSTEEHLQLLAQLAQMFSDEGFVSKLRAANDANALYQTLRSWQPKE